MSDLIRREDVDKAIRSICDLCGEDKKYNGVMCGACNLDSFIREYDDIPSAEPERKWIPVTEALPKEKCCNYINCAECPYNNGDNTDVVHCNDTQKEDDALHYLKEYQAEKANLEIIKGNYQDAVANCEKAENKFKTALKKLDIGTLNEPLDWDTLKTMEGKPVWFEVTDPKALPALDSGWGIVGCTSFTTWEGVKSFSLVKVGVTYVVPIALYGRAWNVYRKERE